jgi:hypothetical protein
MFVWRHRKVSLRRRHTTSSDLLLALGRPIQRRYSKSRMSEIPNWLSSCLLNCLLGLLCGFAGRRLRAPDLASSSELEDHLQCCKIKKSMYTVGELQRSKKACTVQWACGVTGLLLKLMSIQKIVLAYILVTRKKHTCLLR